MTLFVQTTFDAVSLGSLYALLALGLAVIFGIMRLINFAHGELIMIGGYTLLFAFDLFWGLTILCTLLVVTTCAIAMERVAFRPLRGADPATLLVSSFAVSFFIQSLGMLIFTSSPKGVALPKVFVESFTIGDLRIAKLSLLTIGVTVVLIVGLVVFFKRTFLGIQMRGAAEDFEMVRLLGVRANRVIAAAFAMSGVLAAIAAMLYVAQTGTVTPTMGLNPVIVAFIAIVIGGMGSLQGAALGGFMLGVLAVGLQAILPLELRPYRDAFLFGAVIATFLVRPQGLIVARSARVRV